MRKGLIAGGVVMVALGLGLMALPEYEEVPEPEWEPVYTSTVYEEPTQNIYRPITGARLEVREFTQAEAQALMRIAQAEAGNQGVEGMKMVMAVVLNRTADNDYPDTIEGVIKQPHQFQPITDGRYYKVELSPEVHQALADIEKGEPIDTEVVAFEVTSSNSLERYFDYAYTVGDHAFYTEKGDDAD